MRQGDALGTDWGHFLRRQLQLEDAVELLRVLVTVMRVGVCKPAVRTDEGRAELELPLAVAVRLAGPRACGRYPAEAT
eukprot:CAMPEP_0196688400 /NCGR_PEP_ID=MMETSP1090-20130531/16340_1 /TAXON_ID=37098 /ORGANISM="Isochrysis sp, Strain CCMP1244" /LENGTH=77 /DNA_ID=CAMNT_0042027297 /DNA_START=159 /DNA_END=388 /DNA_ORIENTATION=+